MSTPASQLPDFDTFVRARSTAAVRNPRPARAPARRAQLPPVDPRLDEFVQNVMGDAAARTGYTYKLGEGSRTPEQQASKVAAGYSRTYHSKHLTGHGRDVLAFDSDGRYITDGSSPAYQALGDAYREKAASANLPVRWGGEFHDFYDPGHFEIENDGATPPPVQPPDFDEFVRSRNIPDFDDWKAQRASGDDEVVTVNARNAVTPAPPPAPALPERESFDVRTMEGRARRDTRAALERTPGAYLEVSVPVSDVEHADGSRLVRDAYRSAVEARGVPGEFFDEWAKANVPTGYHIRSGRGEELTAADAYDEGSKAARIRLDANHISQIVDAYKRSRGTFGRLRDWAGSDEESSGEKVLDAAGAVGGPIAKGAGYVARPFQATSAAVFSAARGHNPLPVAYKTLTTGETPQEGTNPVGNYLRDSAVLNRINPRLGGLLGGGADVILDPSNLLALGIVGKGAKALVGAGRLSRAAEEVGALGRTLGVLERSLVDARPLGLTAAGAGEGGDLAALEDRLSRVLEVTRKLKAGEALTPEESALHAEVKAAAEAAPSGAVRDEQLKYARERYEHHVEQAANAPSRAARENAQGLADDYAREVERLQSGGVEPSPEGYDVADARPSRFNSAATGGPSAPLWKRAARNVAGAVQLPKVKAGWDLSATGRQGLAQALAHPTYLKEAFAEQLKAFASEDAFNELVQSIRSRPDFEAMNDAGLFLSSTGPEAEEVFASKFVRKIPGVRASDRAYSAALDSIRTQAWDNYVSSLPEHLRDNPETLRAVAHLVNISTGRGAVPVLDRSAIGRKIVNALNVPFFSPRNTASKFNLISPARVIRNLSNPATRPVAWLQMRDAMRGLGTLGTTVALAHFAGADVGIDPRSSDFGKLRVGHAVYDLTGGEGFTVRYLVGMARAFRDVESGKKLKPRETPAALTLHYLRSQLQPVAAAAVDLKTGKTFDGQPVTKATVAADLVVPFVVADMYKGWTDAGGSTLTDAWEGKEFKIAFGGAARALPGVIGVGVNFYDKSTGGKGARPAPPPQPNVDDKGEPAARPISELRTPGGARREVRRAAEAADTDAEPTFIEFPEAMRGESNVPRSAMPQIKGEHRGAMVNFLKGRGITHRRVDVPAGSLKPSQADYSPEKVARAQRHTGPERRILISSDGHVADGHHQWLSKLHKDAKEQVPAIELDAPIQQLLLEMARFPSSGVDDASA